MTPSDSAEAIPSAKPTSWTKPLLAVLLIAVILLAGVSVYQQQEIATSRARTTTVTSTLTLSESGSEASSVSGVEFLVTLNATTVRVGQSLNVTMALLNTLPETNRVPEGGNWSFQGFPVAFWPGCIVEEPVEFVVLKGDYTASSLKEMATNSSVGYACSGIFRIDLLGFQPNSDVALLTGTSMVGGISPNQTTGPYRLFTNFTVSGYWDYPINSTEAQDLNTPVSGGTTFAYPEVSPVPAYRFGPGTYTLLAEDEWGQVEILHLVIG